MLQTWKPFLYDEIPRSKKSGLFEETIYNAEK